MKTEIEKRIHQVLALYPQLQGNCINVHVDGEIVVLNGCVNTWEEKIAIFEAVRTFSNIKAIYDLVMVFPQKQCFSNSADTHKIVYKLPTHGKSWHREIPRNGSPYTL